MRWGAQQGLVFDVLRMCKQHSQPAPLATHNPLRSQRVRLRRMPDARRRKPDSLDKPGNKWPGEPSVPPNVCPQGRMPRTPPRIRVRGEGTEKDLAEAVAHIVQGSAAWLPLRFCGLTGLTGTPSRASHWSRAASVFTGVTGAGSP